ncbi:MAG TPA: tetratricopeptide repeat protein [Ktedonobacterales bacterium]
MDAFVAMLGHANASALNPSARASAEHIVQALGYHTLAVHLAGAYAAAERRDLATLASELSTSMGGLELASDESMPETVRRSFTRSLETLSPEAQRLFAALAAFATPEFGRQAVLALGHALGQARPESSLHALMARALINASTDGEMEAANDRERLRLHPLLWAMAQEIYHGWPPSDQDLAALTVARYLAIYAEAHQTAYAELAADEANLSGALEWAHAHDQPMLVADLAHGMRKFWDVRGRKQMAVHYLAWGVAAAEATGQAQGNPDARQHWAELQLEYGHMLVRTGEPQSGVAAIQRSLDTFRDIQDRPGEGAALRVLAEAALWQGQHEAARKYLAQALVIQRTTSDQGSIGETLSQLGITTLWRGQPVAAQEYLLQALDIQRQIGNQRGEAEALCYLGHVALWHGHHQVAEDYLTQACALDRATGDRQGEETDIALLGLVALRRGQGERADELLAQALTIYREIGDRAGEGLALRLYGELALQRMQLDLASEYLTHALAIVHEFSDQVSEGFVLRLLGDVALARQQAAVATDYFDQALSIQRDIDDQHYIVRTLYSIGRLAEAQHDLERAEAQYREGLKLAIELEQGPEIALGQLALGRLLAERLDRRQEARPLLAEAAQRFSEMDMPEAQMGETALAQLDAARESEQA